MELHQPRLGDLVGRFMSEMHRYDAGRTLPLLHAAKLTTPQQAVLEFVHTPRTISAVAKHIGLSLPATSQLIQKLVRNQQVRRTEGVHDRREKTAVLTAKGKALVERIANARAARFEASLAHLSPRAAARLSSALIDAIDELSKRHLAV